MVDFDQSLRLNFEAEAEERCLPISFLDKSWSHAMRKNMQEIIPGLFLGPYLSASKSHLGTLIQNGITHIICVRQEDESHFIRPNFETQFKYMVLELSDSIYENIIPHFASVRRFMHDCRAHGGKVLIHGNTGCSRSAALVLAFIMEEYSLTYKDAYKYVQERRVCINPNVGFIAQLKEFEPILHARRALELSGSCFPTHRPNKRPHEDDEADQEVKEFVTPIPPPPSPVHFSHPIHSQDSFSMTNAWFHQ